MSQRYIGFAFDGSLGIAGHECDSIQYVYARCMGDARAVQRRGGQASVRICALDGYGEPGRVVLDMTLPVLAGNTYGWDLTGWDASEGRAR